MGRDKATETVMQNLTGIVSEKEIAGGLGEINALFNQQPPAVPFLTRYLLLAQ